MFSKSSKGSLAMFALMFSKRRFLLPHSWGWFALSSCSTTSWLPASLPRLSWASWTPWSVSIILGNLALLQSQGEVVGFLVTMHVVMVGLISQDDDKPFSMNHAVILLSSAMLKANIARVGLGSIIACLCHHRGQETQHQPSFLSPCGGR